MSKNDDSMKEAWSDVADSFGALGRLMKRGGPAADPSSDDTGATATDDDAVTGEPSAGDATATSDSDPDATGHGDTGRADPAAALRDAFDRVRAATRQMGDRTAELVHDDDVKAQARSALGSLGDALTSTFDVVGSQLNGLFARSSDDEPTSDPSTDDPSTDDPSTGDPTPDLSTDDQHTNDPTPDLSTGDEPDDSDS